MTRPRRRGDEGQVTAFVVTITAALALLFALVYEGGNALTERSRALSLAQEAARAGAQQLDLAAYRAGQPASLNAADAEQAALAFLDNAGASGTASVDGDTVTVTATINYQFVMLPLGTRALSGTASATPYTTE